MPRRRRRPNEKQGENPNPEPQNGEPADQPNSPAGESPRGGDSRPERTRAERSGGRRQGGQRPAGQRPAGQRPAGQRPAGQRPARPNQPGSKPGGRSGSRPQGERRNRPPAEPSGEPPVEEQASAPDRGIPRPVGEKSGARQAAKPGGRPSGRPQGRQGGPGADRPKERGSNRRGGSRFREVDSYSSYSSYASFTPSAPIRTNRGIKARSQGGSFTRTWWADRWIAAMERLVEPPRLQRGRSYARSGQVLSIQETDHGIEARVQGSRPTPYKVTIQVTPLRDRQWEQVIDAMSEQALFTAQLLAGEMPDDIEDAFKAAGISLFPDSVGDLVTDCSCPDWANPCKHVAATQYILGDMFDDDPFLLFRMRGRNQEQILQALRARRVGEGEVLNEEQEAAAPEVETFTPLEETLGHFWESVDPLETFPLTIRPASVDMPLLKRLGEPSFLNNESLETLLKPVYDTFMRSALLAAYSDEEPYESSSNGNGSNGDNGGGGLE